MRLGLSILAVASFLGSAAPAQPRHGDLIVSGYKQFSIGGTFYVSPTSTGTYSTLVWHLKQRPGPVKMAANNHDLIEARLGIPNSVVRFDPVTLSTTTLFSGIACSDLALDGDGSWALSGVAGQQNMLWLLKTTSAALTTVATVPQGASGGYYDTITIDRDRSALGPYIVGRYDRSTSPVLVAINRNGAVTTVVANNMPNVHGVSVDPASGDYFVCAETAGLYRVPKSGVSPSLVARPFSNTLHMRFAQDGSAWMVGRIGTTTWELKRVTPQGVVLRTIPLAGLPIVPFGLEIYGRRRLVCNLPSPQTNTVAVTVESRHPFVQPGKSRYVLAASFAQRPGYVMPNNERLDLDTATDPLFYATVFNALPGIFVNFQGVIGPGARATATVNIPAALRGSNIPIFVAGVILNQNGQLIEVTNTHWFVL